jgi:hypothetical protein
VIWVADAAKVSGRFFIIKAESWYDARRIAMIRFGVGPDEVSLQAIDDQYCLKYDCRCERRHVAVEIELKWEGSDYSAHGGRVLFWRAPSRGDEEWKTMESFR